MNQQQKCDILYLLVGKKEEKKKEEKGRIIYLQMNALMEHVVVINVFRVSDTLEVFFA